MFGTPQVHVQIISNHVTKYGIPSENFQLRAFNWLPADSESTHTHTHTHILIIATPPPPLSLAEH